MLACVFEFGNMYLNEAKQRETAMNNKQLFKQAHKIARSTVVEVGDYQIAFKLVLEELRTPKTTTSKLKVFVKYAPELSMMIFVCSLIVLLGGGFGASMVYYGVSNTLPALTVLSGALTASTMYLFYMIMAKEIELFVSNYHHALKGVNYEY